MLGEQKEASSTRSSAKKAYYFIAKAMSRKTSLEFFIYLCWSVRRNVKDISSGRILAVNIKQNICFDAPQEKELQNLKILTSWSEE